MTQAEPKILVELNIAKLLAPVGDPRVQEFIDNIERINGLAARMPGFIWREEVDETKIRADRHIDPELVWTLSTWSSATALENFVWKTLHKKFFDRREEWFALIQSHSVAFWWSDPTENINSFDAFDRLEYLDKNGPSQRAFGWEDLRAGTFG